MKEDDVAREGSHPVVTSSGSDLSSLLERVREATGPDRELDALIGATCANLHLDDDDSGFEVRASGGMISYHQDGKIVGFDPALEYTASLDAALHLVERVLPGWGYALMSAHFDTGRPAAVFWNDGAKHAADGATLELAINEAILRTLLETLETPGPGPAPQKKLK